MTPIAKITRILVPIDFSRSAEAACHLAARLANRIEAGLVVLHAFPSVDMALQVRGTTGRTQAEVFRDLHKRLWDWCDMVLPEELRRFLTIEVQVVVGEPTEGIAWATRASRADLIVMATHGRSGVSHLLVGSVTEAVIRAAPAPVLALRRGQEGHPLAEVKRILWATDLSPASEGAWRYLLMLADLFSAEVSLLHVVNSIELAGFAEMPVPPPAGWIEGQLAVIERELDRRQQEVEALGLGARRKVTVGFPAETIIAEAERADLIVMGTHGRTGLPHVLLGSVAEAVLRKAPCPVLVVQARRRAGHQS